MQNRVLTEHHNLFPELELGLLGSAISFRRLNGYSFSPQNGKAS